MSDKTTKSEIQSLLGLMKRSRKRKTKILTGQTTDEATDQMTEKSSDEGFDRIDRLKTRSNLRKQEK